MSKKTTETKFYALESNENGLTNVIILPEAETFVTIGSQNGAIDFENAKSAINAASDLLKFGMYQNPETTIGLHLSNRVIRPNLDTNIGAISTQYDGSKYPKPSEREHPQGWAQLNCRNGRFYISAFSKNECSTRSRKHDFVDLLLRGIGIHIRVVPVNHTKDENGMGLVDKIVASWEAPLEEAIKMRNEGIAKAQLRRTLQSAVTTKSVEEQTIAPLNMAINLVVLSTGEVVNIVEHESCKVEVHDRRGAIVTIPWDGSAFARTKMIEIAQRGYRVELKAK